MSGDIKTSFLSGDKERRDIFILPPEDVWGILKCCPESTMRLRKAVSGVALKKKWDRLQRSLLSHGFTSCSLDPCAFFLLEQSRVRGLVGVHVDDLLERRRRSAWQHNAGGQACVRLRCLGCRSHEVQGKTVDADGRTAKSKLTWTTTNMICRMSSSHKKTNSNQKGC